MTTMKDGTVTNGRRKSWRQTEENIVQWKQKNIREGFVVVDEAQLSKLIKREPIQTYYKLEAAPFATGLFASVRRCESLTTGEKFAAKFSNRKRYGEDCSAEIYHEIALLSLCGSAPRIIQIHDVFETPHEIILVMEYAPGGDLQTIIDDNLVPFESDVVFFIRQCVEGLEYLHQRKIAHLDIKPQNVVMMGQFPNCDIKLCDLEISRVILDGSNIREILGTPDYVAPEILHYDPITLAADMWSLGVTTYVLLTGFSPFGGETDQETFCNISKGELDLTDELFEDISDSAIDFIRSLLVKDPKLRPTSSQCLKHPWLAQKQPVKIPSSPSALRKYLSKSREALFDKVVQQHRNSLRKHTLQSQMLRTTRLCESQMSLVSKSREKLLNQDRLSPSFSRSIEKIYGLRSLSKSQEVLNLYKNGNLMTSQENINNVVSEMLKSRDSINEKSSPEPENKDRKLTRATTADLGVLRHRHRHLRIYSGSSTVSITSDMTEQDEEDREGDAGAVARSENQTEEINTQNKINLEEKGELKESNEEKTNGDDNEKENIFKDNCQEMKEENNENGTIYENLENTTADGVEEPRFTVAQLITAFNKHQETVTKTSLEVTMTAQQREVKIPPIQHYSTQVPFPTGPTALRLFIPDIDLVEVPKKSRPRHSIRINPTTETIPNDNCQTAPILLQTSIDNIEVLINKIEIEQPSYLRSSSLSSETSTAISTEETTPETSLEPIQDGYDSKPPTRPSTLRVNSKRSKSQSPSPVAEQDKNQTRKLSAGSYGNNNKQTEPARKISASSNGPSRKTSIVEKSPVPQRKISSFEKSPVPQRKNKTEQSPTPVRKTSTTAPEFKIVGLGERNRKSHGISYKIEFASPVVSRRFPVRTPGVCAKTTISSELKKQENIRPKKK